MHDRLLGSSTCGSLVAISHVISQNWRDRLSSTSVADHILGSFRLDYEDEIEYEYDFRISDQ